MLEAMILQTLNKYPQLPGHGRLVELAATPVSNPEVVAHEAHDEGSTHAIEFEVEGTVCLYSRGTAAGNDAAGDNGFSMIITKLLHRYRPRNLYVATFSRLVRSHYFSHQIFTVLHDYRITLHDGTSDPIQCWTQQGRMRWQMLVLFVDMEREAILMRLTLGRLARHRRGEWIQTYRSVPLGYRILDRKLEVDPDAHDVVNKAIRVIGTPGLDMPEMLRALGDIGVGVPIDSTGWTYDRTWRWNGTPYVPERHRRQAVTDSSDPHQTNAPRADTGEESHTSASDDPDETFPTSDGAFEVLVELSDADEPDSLDAEFDNETNHAPGTRPRRRLIHEQGDATQPAQRLMRYLDLWETGLLRLRLRSPLDVDGYADYPVIRDTDEPNDFGYLELDYRPGHPPRPWATPQEFAAARAAVELRLAQADRRPDTAKRRLPFLGQISRWTADGHAYALLPAAGGGRTPTYTLYSQPLHDGPTRTPNGAPIKIRWKTGNRLRPDLAKLLTVDAADLHAAVSSAAINALNGGLTLTPSKEAPPSFLGGDTPRRRRNLQRQISENEERAENFLTRASKADAEPEFAEFCERKARELINEAAAYRVELGDLTNRTPGELPSTITIDTNLVATVIAGLRTCRSHVPANTANLLRDVIADFRINRVGPHAHFTYYLKLPAQDGIALAGPISGRLPQRLGSDQPGNLDPVTRAAIQTERAREIARTFLTTDTPMGDIIRNHPQATGASDAERAHDYLIRQGLSTQAARAATTATPLRTRSTIWALLHDEPTDEDLHPSFVNHIRHTYIDPGTIPVTGPSWMSNNTVQYAIFDRVRRRHLQQQPPEPHDEFKAWAANSGLGTAAAAAYLKKSDGRHASYTRRLVARIHADPNGHRAVNLLDCPHCHHKVDTWAKVQENTEPVLCSNCLRSPDPQSPIYPPEYLDLNIEAARRRVLEVNPVARHDKTGYLVSVDISRNIYEWAEANNMWDGQRRVVTKSLIETYYLAIVEGHVEDPAAIRDWAEQNGHSTGTRGRIPQQLTNLFITTLLDRNRNPVREWAARNDRIFPRSTAERHRLMLDYAEHARRQSQPGS